MGRKDCSEERFYIVYKYTCKANGKVYIGQTRRSLKERADSNGINYKGCTYFYNAIKKYGWDNFIGEILEDNLTLEEANELETKYILEYDSTNREKGYNIMLGGGNRTVAESTRKKLSEINKGRVSTFKGHHFTEESKRKLSESLIGKTPWNKGKKNIYSEDTLQRMRKSKKGQSAKKALCVELNRVFNSIGEASEELGIERSSIGKALVGSRKTAGGYHWEYADKEDNYVGRHRKIACVETGVIYNSKKQAARETGVPIKAITAYLNNKRDIKGELHWMYLEDYEKYKESRRVPLEMRKRISETLRGRPTGRKGKKLTGKALENVTNSNRKHGTPIICVELNKVFNTVREAGDFIREGANTSNIINVAKGKRSTAYGYHWKYVDESNIGHTLKRKVICTDTGDIYESVVEASAKNDLSKITMLRLLKGDWDEYEGRHYKYLDEYEREHKDNP